MFSNLKKISREKSQNSRNCEQKVCRLVEEYKIFLVTENVKLYPIYLKDYVNTK